MQKNPPRLLLTIFILFFSINLASAQNPDTLHLSVPEAEKLFLQNNLFVLAQHYNVDINKALVQQARYWDNPVLNTDQNIYDGKFFRHTSDYGQVYLQLQQVIKTAGKRNKQVQLASDAVLSAEQQLDDLLRNLRYTLRTDLANLDQQLRTLKIYTDEAAALQVLVVGMDAELKAGNISQKDNIRIKALLFNLQSDAVALQGQVADTQKELATLLQVKGDTVYMPVFTGTPPTTVSYTLTQLLDSARTNRPDYRLAQTNLLAQQHNLSYQKALAVPDLTVGVEYDRLSSYVPNLWGLELSLPIPILNRNKGNIKAAQLSISQASVQVLQAGRQAEQEVIASYNKLLTIQKLQQAIPNDFMGQYDKLMENMVQSYRGRQVSLLEFIDFFDAYKDATTNMIQQQNNLRNAAEELNFSVGATLVTNN
ncbi:MAG TPA: TolC family protein [Chitinophagaceae bacterium]